MQLKWVSCAQFTICAQVRLKRCSKVCVSNWSLKANQMLMFGISQERNNMHRNQEDTAVHQRVLCHSRDTQQVVQLLSSCCRYIATYCAALCSGVHGQACLNRMAELMRKLTNGSIKRRRMWLALVVSGMWVLSATITDWYVWVCHLHIW